ncbi:nucleoside-diphosphate sugar epimerase [Pedobacter psychrophilus]|uniref:Nucleoside-diphosphate sugar epimerase n=1 Tax=Pedobacter psychrophilus TaxID=1826909 RepID=A0A179DDR3_9SPHI|nr:NAD(P)H-binding protein [Pedobacter psychrophilus]OAQ39176.1 nucleoside-diphosphate sugar epimerase [Pedobacter psychrophilus]
MALKAIVLGASGLIGSNLLSIILSDDNYEEVIVFVRKKLTLKSSKLIQIITDFNNLDELKNATKADVVFCCLGSTKKKTPNLEKYKKVDHDIPLFIANEALKNGASQYHIVSALGANLNSSNFYSRMKGEIENDLKDLNYPSLFIYQPSFLEGDRNEYRPLEKIMSPIMKGLNFLLIGPLRKYQSIAAEDVAKAMVKESIKNKRGIFVIESDQIKELA